MGGKQGAAGVSVYLEFCFSGIRDSLMAFGTMGRRPNFFAENQASMLKLMGVGGRGGFGLWPDFSRYALLAHFPSQELAVAALSNSIELQRYRHRAHSELCCLLSPTASHGSWGGSQPYPELATARGGTVAVLTRATLAFRRIPAFWRRVRSSAAHMAHHPACIYAVGIGEYPVFMQATFSVWSSLEGMRQAAYGTGGAHAPVVQATRRDAWYTEELFARFNLLEVQGTGRYSELALRFTPA